MNCPWCAFRFRVLAANADRIPEVAPLICESCGAISLLVDMVPRKPTPEELTAIKASPAWREVLEPVSRLIRDSKAPPPDRSKVTLTDGSPVTADHRELRSDGQQKGYVVLSEEERRRGFVRPVRRAYVHLKCGTETTMGLALAETYARDPGFYSGTFCVSCGSHFPLDQFVWAGTDETVGS
jgi:hypothetical protein